jgi:hypothetical protein
MKARGAVETNPIVQEEWPFQLRKQDVVLGQIVRAPCYVVGFFLLND